MWFKKALFVYHALLVANTDARPKKNGGTLLQRRHAVEDVGAPVVVPRQQTSRNETKPEVIFPATFESRTTQVLVLSTSDQSQATSVSKSSTLLVVISSTSSSLQERPKLSPTLNLISVSSFITSSHVSPIPTKSVQVETTNSAHEQSLSKIGSDSPTNLSDTTSDKITSTVSSLVTPSHGLSSSNHFSSVVLGSNSRTTSHSTPTPTPAPTSTSQTMEPLQTSSIPQAESRSQQQLQHSTTSSLSILSTSIFLQPFQSTLAVSASLAGSISLPSTPIPTSSVVSQSTLLTNETPSFMSKSDSSTLLISQAKTITETIAPTSTLSPSTLSPSTLSPSTLSPSTLSPSTLSPSTLSPSTLSPSTLSPATSFTSNGTPVFSQSTSDIIASFIQITTGFTSISTSTPLLPPSQFLESPVANLTSLSPNLSMVMSNTMAAGSSLPASNSGLPPTTQSVSASATIVTASSSKFDIFLPVESGSSIPVASVITTSNLLVNKPTMLPPSSSNTQDNNQTSTQRMIVSATTLSTVILPIVPSPDMAGISRNNSAVLPSSRPVTNVTAPFSSPTPLQTTRTTLAWTNATARSSLTHSESTQPTSIFINPNRTRSGELDKTLMPFLPNTSIAVTPLATTILPSDAVTATSTPTLSETRPEGSTTLLVIVGMEATNTAPTSATPTASQAAAAPPPAPLTTTQTAGVAVGSTAGVLLAVVAAIFLVRRYHANQLARRTSTGSIYPKVAYIYDPADRENGGSNGGSSSALMSGGASGISPEPPQYTRTYDRRQSNGFTTRYSDPGNPFRDPVDPYRDTEEPAPEHYDGGRDSIHAPVDAAAAFAAAVAGFAASEHQSPATSNYSTLQSPYHVTYPSPTLSPLLTNSNSYHRHTRSISRSSFASFSNRYPPLSPYVQQPSYARESDRATTILDAPEEPFEYDILMPIDTQTETPDSVMVHAPPPTPVPTTQQNGKLVSPVSPVETYDFQHAQEGFKTSLTSNSSTTLGQLDRFSLAYDSSSGATYIRIGSKDSSPQQPAPPVSPVSPIVPVHRGWDDIKRYSSESSVASSRAMPAPLSFNTPPPIKLSPLPAKKKSLLQLRRKEPALAGQGHVMKSSISQPLTVKPSHKYDKDLAFEAQRRSLLAKLNSMGGPRTQGTVSPAPSASSSDYSRESGSKRRDENIAAAQVRLNGNYF